MSETAQQEKVTQLPALQTRKPSEIRVVTDPIAVLDTGRFEHMQRIAGVMAHSNLVPHSLCMIKEGTEMVPLPLETVVANCFLVVNQAVRWNMDPFAVAQCVSVVHGKLCYEGKLIAAVLEAKLGIRLKYKWDGKAGEQSGIEVSGTFPDGSIESVRGTVTEWKTTGAGSPWGQAKNYQRMLAYRGAREWCRLFAPGLMLGVLSDDEIEVLADEGRGARARDVTPRDEPPAPPPAPSATPSVEAPATVPDAVPLMDAQITKVNEVTAEVIGNPEAKAADIPDGAKDPEGFLKWVDDKLAAVTDPDELNPVWDAHVEPRLKDLFPPDQEEAIGHFRKHERRLVG